MKDHYCYLACELVDLAEGCCEICDNPHNIGEHKFNTGLGALLCGKCRTIVAYGLVSQGYCQECKEIVFAPIDTH